MPEVRTEYEQRGHYLYIDNTLPIRCIKHSTNETYAVIIGSAKRPGFDSEWVDKETARTILKEVAYKLMSMAAQL